MGEAQRCGLLLAHWGLALAVRPPVVTQVLLVAVQVPLHAESHPLVTGAQLSLTPAPLVRALDGPLGKGVSVVVQVGAAAMALQVTVAAVVGVAAPVCGIFGFTSATDSTVTAVGPIGEEGHLPGHLFDHLVQVQDPTLGWNHTSKCHQEAQQGKFHGPSTEQWSAFIVSVG